MTYHIRVNLLPQFVDFVHVRPHFQQTTRPKPSSGLSRWTLDRGAVHAGI